MKITEIRQVTHFDKSLVNIPHSITLADDSFKIIDMIDLLLRAKAFFTLMKSLQIKLEPSLPVLQSWIGLF